MDFNKFNIAMARSTLSVRSTFSNLMISFLNGTLKLPFRYNATSGFLNALAGRDFNVFSIRPYNEILSSIISS